MNKENDHNKSCKTVVVIYCTYICSTLERAALGAQEDILEVELDVVGDVGHGEAAGKQERVAPPSR
jgi:hypothetical protein